MSPSSPAYYSCFPPQNHTIMDSHFYESLLARSGSLSFNNLTALLNRGEVEEFKICQILEQNRTTAHVQLTKRSSTSRNEVRLLTSSTLIESMSKFSRVDLCSALSQEQFPSRFPTISTRTAAQKSSKEVQKGKRE